MKLVDTVTGVQDGKYSPPPRSQKATESKSRHRVLVRDRTFYKTFQSSVCQSS